jgi:hypothetical protein
MKIFSTEETEKIEAFVNDYRKIFENASYLAVQMGKLEEEMTILAANMDLLKTEETTFYKEVAEKNGLTIDEVILESSKIATIIQKMMKR